MRLFRHLTDINNNKDELNKLRIELLLKTCRCANLDKIFQKLKLNEDELLKADLDKSYCLNEGLDYLELNFPGIFQKIDEEYEQVHISMSLNDFFINKFMKNEMDHIKVLLNLVLFVEALDDDCNTMLRILQDMQISKLYGYDYFLYIYSLIQLNIYIENYKDENYFEDENLDYKFIHKNHWNLLGTIQTQVEEKNTYNTLHLIGEELFKKLFLKLLDDYETFIEAKYSMDDYHWNFIEDKLIYIIKYFDAYKWLNRKQIYLLMENSNIYFKKYADELDGKEKDDYLSKIVMSTIKNEGNVF